MQSQNQTPEKEVQPHKEKKSRVDEILAGIATGNQELINPPVKPELTVEPEVVPATKEEKFGKESEFQKDKKKHQEKSKKPPETPPPAIPAEKPIAPEPLPAAAKADEKINDYGIPETVKVEEKKYTDSDMQRMIRERLERVKQTATPAQIKEIAEDFKASSPDATVEQWEREFEAHVEKVIDKKYQKAQQLRMQEQENKIQSEYETRFSQGMSKYQDFWDVVNKNPITPPMMIATRSMENPAAFLYAASKLHPETLTKIAGMTDTAAQMVEIGRLEERMLKASRATKAPRPLDKIQGDDFEDRTPPKKEQSIEDRIAEHAKMKKGLK
jgi:hypothetical protein